MSIFNTILDEIKKIPSQIARLFTTDAAEQAIRTAAEYAILAAPYVQEVDLVIAPFLGPGCTLTIAAITAAYTKYALPLAEVAVQTPDQLGNALLNLVTALLKKNHAPSAATSVLQTAVQLAVIASQAKK